MRIWDVHPGYLARQQLLGEHRELHGMFNVISQGKKGYSKHPETLRWVGCLPALKQRHDLLVAEMRLRGYQHHSPLPEQDGPILWPETCIDAPHRQFDILADKYAVDQRSGRIPLPANAQQLWAQHKYSVMALDPALYRELGPEVAHGRFRDDMQNLTLLLVNRLRQPPVPGRVHNALLHMWGYVNDEDGVLPETAALLAEQIQQRSLNLQQSYLLHSTALSDISLWV